jgi:hypothetical protein
MPQQLPDPISGQFNMVAGPVPKNWEEAAVIGFAEIGTTLERMGKQPMGAEMVKAYATRLALSMSLEGEDVDTVRKAFESHLTGGRIDRKGMLLAWADLGAFEKKLIERELTDEKERLERFPPPDIQMLLGTRDYLTKNGIADPDGSIATNLTVFAQMRGAQRADYFSPSANLPPADGGEILRNGAQALLQKPK